MHPLANMCLTTDYGMLGIADSSKPLLLSKVRLEHKTVSGSRKDIEKNPTKIQEI